MTIGLLILGMGVSAQIGSDGITEMGNYSNNLRSYKLFNYEKTNLFISRIISSCLQ